MNVVTKAIKWFLGIVCAGLCLVSFIGEFFPHMNGFTFIDANLQKGKTIISSIFSLLLICLPLINAVLFFISIRIRWLSIFAAAGSLIFGLFVELPVSLTEMINGLTKPWIGTVPYKLGTGYHMTSIANNSLLLFSLLFFVSLLVDFLKLKNNEVTPHNEKRK